MEAQIINSATSSHLQKQRALYRESVKNGAIDSVSTSLPLRLWMPQLEPRVVGLRILEEQSVSARSIGMVLNSPDRF